MTPREQNIDRFTRSGSKRAVRMRLSLLVAAFVLVVGCVPASRAQHQHPRHKEDFKRQVEKLEETWRLAQLNGDAETMDRLLSDEYIGITMNGQIVTKTQQLDRMRSRTISLSKIDLDDVKVKLIGQTAVVTSRATVEGTNEGESVHGTYRYTRVYIRTASGSWKITNFEATRVGEPGAAQRARGQNSWPSDAPGANAPAR